MMRAHAIDDITSPQPRVEIVLAQAGRELIVVLTGLRHVVSQCWSRSHYRLFTDIMSAQIYLIN